MATVFDAGSFLPAGVVDRLTDLRVADPSRTAEGAAKRRRRAGLTDDGRLCLLAADHPARAVTAVGDDPIRMADRGDFLARIVRVLLGDAVDGVMATMDVLEELLLLHGLLQDAGGPPLLDDKLLIPSLNRGGLAGAVWELDDPMTGPTAEAVVRRGMDGAKLLLRVEPGDRDSLRTLVACAQAVTELASHGLPTFLEPLSVTRVDGAPKVVKEAAALARLVGVASALGETSAHLWLKLPWCEGFEGVARATTLPIVLLGGPAVGDATPLLEQVADGLATGANVRGTLVGRNVLFPGDEDPLAVARAVYGLVHGGWDVDRASAAVGAERGRDLDALVRWLE